MFIEDLFCKFATSVSMKLGHYDREMIQSFYRQILMGKNFTEKQAGLIIKLLKKYESQLETVLQKNISNELDNPTFKLPFRSINYQKTMKICDHPLYNRAIKMEFPFDETILSSLRAKRSSDPEFSRFSYYDQDEKSWIFALLEKNIITLMPFIEDFNFQLDEELLGYVSQVKEIKKNIEHHLPMVVKHEKYYKIVNLPPFIKVPDTTELVESLFTARKYGVTLWDDSINDELNNLSVDPLVVKFLKSDFTSDFNLDLSQTTITSIIPIIKHLFPCLVIIPGGSELEKLKIAYELFQAMHLENNELSVLFRLNNETDAEFNNFVRSNKLNSPLTSETKVVFLSQHIPKTILTPLQKFNSIINFNYINVHHKLATLIKNQENVINIVEKSQPRRFHFANL